MLYFSEFCGGRPTLPFFTLNYERLHQRLDPTRLGGKLVDHAVTSPSKDMGAGRPARADPLADPRVHPVQGGNRMPPEAGRVVVALVKRSHAAGWRWPRAHSARRTVLP